ncbi:MAG TPA: hypothetical protein VMS56_11955 [Thermoanaerobaculia bacterium]|nr:hypothetical protein [Thermoanaerobaculia bacterium]
MITGFNTDIKHNSRVYHIQTEDKGVANPYIESLVYVGGEILASKKTSYAEQLRTGVDEKWISGMMEQQHKTIIAAIKRGRFENLGDTQSRNEVLESLDTQSAELLPPSALGPAPGVTSPSDDRTLDQVIIDYLAAEAETEHLELSLLNTAEFIAGQPVEFRVATRKSISQSPVPAATLEVKVISTVEAPRVIFRGKTAGDGLATIRCTIPVFHEGTAAIIISAQSPIGNDEVKQLVKRKR